MIVKLKRAFTLLELVFVIVILGVVASIGSSVIVQVYESYIIQKATHNAALKTELAINQLTNRLTYRIDKSLIARHPVTGNLLALNNLDITTPNWEQFNILEWIGYDNDSFSATATPGWSGFLDLNTASAVGVGLRSIVSTGSAFSQVSAISTNLGGGDPALYFVGNRPYKETGGTALASSNADCLHNTTGTGCIFPVTLNTTNGITFTVGSGDYVAGQMRYSEYYQLARSAYAVVFENPHTVPETGGINVWDLRLYYNYQPWENETYIDGSNSLLLRDVSVFRFKSEAGNSLRIKLCTVEQISETETISLCKEKAVIR